MSVLSLLQPHQRERLTPAQRDDVTREQIAVTFGVLPWAAAVHLVVTLGLTLYVIPPDSGPLPRLWPFLSGVIDQATLNVYAAAVEAWQQSMQRAGQRAALMTANLDNLQRACAAGHGDKGIFAQIETLSANPQSAI